eukprot:TRINITY_DN65514_c0_g1_i1.p1 TRINITY_DN65514_c0_g1~~TRINITY_DN65514_c0_g1_i1.p1  ORF type:complete len:154 (-),score=39.25 TRINITY_DN65514_c0_g1_i1:195-656(-)
MARSVAISMVVAMIVIPVAARHEAAFAEDEEINAIDALEILTASDTDGDGELSREEIVTILVGELMHMTEAVNYTEVAKEVHLDFLRHDHDKNGKLNQAEFLEVLAAHANEGAEDVGGSEERDDEDYDGQSVDDEEAEDYYDPSDTIRRAALP